MKTLILIAALALLLTGCVTQDRCLRKFPPEIKEVTKIVTETVTITRDTTIYVRLPAEVVVQTDTVLVDTETGLITSKLSRLETSLAWSTAQIRNSRLHHELQQVDTTIEHRLQDAIREVDRLEKELTEKVTTIEVPRRLNWWQRLRMTIGTLALGSGLGWLVLLILKIRLPFRR